MRIGVQFNLLVKIVAIFITRMSSTFRFFKCAETYFCYVIKNCKGEFNYTTSSGVCFVPLHVTPLLGVWTEIIIPVSVSRPPRVYSFIAVIFYDFVVVFNRGVTSVCLSILLYIIIECS